MRVKWTIAVMSALALALLTMPVDLPWASTAASAAGACPANAKAANLNFSLKDMHNKPVRLSDYKGKVILLDFWATWCVPCKTEMPWFSEFQARYAQSGLQVLGVSVDDTLEKLTPYVRDLKVNYPVLQGLNQDALQDAYGPLWGIPVTVLISRDGKVCGRHTGLAPKDAVENEIKGLL
jgi:thiol-disulfide isomerase/thioredoxin